MDELKRRLLLSRKAVQTLREALGEPPSGIVRDAAIQRFEYSFEATWKAAQRYLHFVEGVEVASPNAAIRSCHASGLLDETAARLALQMTGDRNLTVHTYDEALAARIFQWLPSYADLLSGWLDALERRGMAAETS